MQKDRYFGETLEKCEFCLMQKSWYPCNVGGLVEHNDSNLKNIDILFFMRRYQRYGCDMTEIHIVCTSTFQLNFIITHSLSSEMVLNVSFDIEKTIGNVFECFQDGRQIASMVVFSCLGGHYCGLGQLASWSCIWVPSTAVLFNNQNPYQANSLMCQKIKKCATINHFLLILKY